MEISYNLHTVNQGGQGQMFP